MEENIKLSEKYKDFDFREWENLTIEEAKKLAFDFIKFRAELLRKELKEIKKEY